MAEATATAQGRTRFWLSVLGVPRWLAVIGAVALGSGAQGCVTFTRADGVTYHLVVGFGVIRTKVHEESGIVATDSRSLGVVVSDRPGLKLGVGYAADTVVSVPADAKDVLVEVSRRPLGPLVVEAPAVGGAPDPKP